MRWPWRKPEPETYDAPLDGDRVILMGRTLQLPLPAKPGDRFTEEAAASIVGQTPTLNVNGLRLGPSKITAATLQEDGSILVTIVAEDPT